MRASALWLLCTSGIATACGDSPDSAGKAGWVAASWTGADTGRMAGSGIAEWCAERRALEIRGVQGDTGLAVVLYPVDSIEPDTFRVVLPEGADTLAPSGAIGLRLFEANAVQGYQGDSGAIVLQRAESGQLSGTIAARARSVVNGQQVRLTGQLRNLNVVPQGRGCVPEPLSDSADTNAGPSSTDVD